MSAYRLLGTLVACPRCDGPVRADRGGVKRGGCDVCDGTGLLLVNDLRE